MNPPRVLTIASYALALALGITAMLVPFSISAQGPNATPTPDGQMGVQKSNDDIMTEQAKVTPPKGIKVAPEPGRGPTKQPNPNSPAVSSGGSLDETTALLLVGMVSAAVVGLVFYRIFARPS